MLPYEVTVNAIRTADAASALTHEYDVSPDGRRFLMIKGAPPTGEGSAAPVQLVVVQNWLGVLKRLVPAK
jgi:hypothetical protein